MRSFRNILLSMDREGEQRAGDGRRGGKKGKNDNEFPNLPKGKTGGDITIGIVGTQFDCRTGKGGERRGKNLREMI